MHETNKEILDKVTRRDQWFARIVVILLLGGIAAWSMTFLKFGCGL